MNTESESSKSGQNSDFDKLEAGVPATKLDDTAAILASKLQEEKDGRCEERFAWLFGVVLLIDCLAFPPIGAGSIPIAILEVVFLIYMAKMLGVDWVVVHLERALSAIGKDKKGD